MRLIPGMPLVVLSIVVAAGCAVVPSPPALPLVGTGASHERFAGLWRGAVDAVDDRFDGEIELRLRPADDATFAAPGGLAGRILWVRVSGSSLAGAFAPQYSPRCSCDVYTTFQAVLEGSTLRGTLRQRVKMEWQDAGDWTAACAGRMTLGPEAGEDGVFRWRGGRAGVPGSSSAKARRAAR